MAAGYGEDLLDKKGTAQLIEHALQAVRKSKRESGQIDLDNAKEELMSTLIVSSFGKERCVVCLERPADYVCMPCGHQCACKQDLIQWECCPICRVPIEYRFDATRIVRSGFPND